MCRPGVTNRYVNSGERKDDEQERENKGISAVYTHGMGVAAWSKELSSSNLPCRRGDRA